MELMDLRRGLLMAMASGNYSIYDGEISVNSVSNTIEIPLRGNPVIVFFFLNNYNDYPPSDYNAGICGGIYYSSVFPFSAGYATARYIFSFYNEKVDYWTNGVTYTISETSIIVSNNRGQSTIPGATYHYVVMCKK